MKAHHRTTALLILASAPIAHAHEDTPLRLMSDGFIAGVPAPFRRIQLHIEELGTSKVRVTLSIGDRVSTILPCAANLIKSISVDDVQVSGSWYGYFAGDPQSYYVNVQFLDPWHPPLTADPFPARSSYLFYFNLNTGELMGADRRIVTIHGADYEQHPFPKGCKVAVTALR